MNICPLRIAVLLGLASLACLAVGTAGGSPAPERTGQRPAVPPAQTAFFEILPQPVLRGLIHLPGLLVTEADTVLLIAQSRITKGDHDPSDLVLTRSVDQGRTWSAPLKIFDSGDSRRIGYSCVLVEDRTTKPHTILALYTVGPAGWKSEQLVAYGRRSTDEGITWGEPFALKTDGDPESKPSNGGHGFQFANGRLVIPGRGNFLVSDDHGVTWKTFGTAETPETKVLPLVRGDGRDANAVYLITRRSTTFRVYGDYGEKLLEQGDHHNEFTTLGRNPGLARYSTKQDGAANIMLMSGLHDMKNRVFSLTFSTDEGRTWSARKKIDNEAWYSDLGVTKDKTILAAYTVAFSADLKIARFNLDWVMGR